MGQRNCRWHETFWY